jgi:nuclear pore complex protein Nup133
LNIWYTRTDEVVESLHGHVFSSASHALLLTHEQALIWPYTLPVTHPEVFSFKLPFTSTPGDPLPLGTLVTSSTTSAEPGLVVVMPTTGKIIYWESIASAAAQDLFRYQARGIEGSLPSLFSGEVVTAIENAEPAGFLISYSSGRLAHLSVRDAQGRPAVITQLLKVNGTNVSGGIFGSLKNAFGSSGWRRDIVAIRPGQILGRGERELVVVTANGIFQRWSVNRGGQYSLIREQDGRQPMVMALGRIDIVQRQVDASEFSVLDMAIMHGASDSAELSIIGVQKDIKVLVLAAFGGQETTQYGLLELHLGEGSGRVGDVYPITCYQTPLYDERRPSLYIPHPEHTAFIVFHKAVVVLTIAKGPANPNDQLLAEAGEPLTLRTFQDVIDFRDDLEVDVTVVGSGAEDVVDAGKLGNDDSQTNRWRSKDPACALVVKGVGVIRIAAYKPKISEEEETSTKVTAKGKIEQAVFFGFLDANLLRFSARKDQFSIEEVEAAALQITSEILSSTSPFIKTLTPSLDQQLKSRSQALRSLAIYLRDNYSTLPRLVKWQLMWGAEKLEAARSIWRNYDARLKETGKVEGLLAELIDAIHEDYKTVPKEDEGEVDRVRQWFLRDVERIDTLLPWAFNLVRIRHQGKDVDRSHTLTSIYEANDVVIGALEHAFNFRQQNAPLYGLASDEMKEGVLLEGYEGLPEFWTSKDLVLQATRKLVDLSMTAAEDGLFHSTAIKDTPDHRLVTRVAAVAVRQVEIVNKIFLERSKWCSAQIAEALRQRGTELNFQHSDIRSKQMKKLLRVGHVDDAFRLAEKYRDFPTLVDLVADQCTRAEMRQAEKDCGEEEYQALEVKLKSLDARIDGYYKRFGDDWASALYSSQILLGKTGILMTQTPQKDYLTRFLDGHPAYAKLRWMDEIDRLNYGVAGDILLDVAEKECDLWSKKIELSIGKLASLAEPAYLAEKYPNEAEKQGELRGIDDDLKLVNIQETLHKYMGPVLRTALDKDAEVELAMDQFGSRTTDGKESLKALLREGIEQVVHHKLLEVELLIDVLTLMDQNYYNDFRDPDNTMEGQEFYYALTALKLAELKPSNKNLAEKLIWRRCYLRDDWVEVNNTHLQPDQQVQDKLKETGLFRTLKACFANGMCMLLLFEGPSTLTICADLFTQSAGSSSFAFSEQGTTFKPVSPSECIAAGTTIQSLNSRFRHAEEGIKEKLVEDMKKEETAMKRFMDLGRMGEWFDSVVSLAKDEAEKDALKTLESKDEGEIPYYLQSFDQAELNGDFAFDQTSAQNLPEQTYGGDDEDPSMLQVNHAYDQENLEQEYSEDEDVDMADG